MLRQYRVPRRCALRTGVLSEARSQLRGDYESMMKMMVLGALMASAAAGLAQESRQDASVSAIGVFAPTTNGTGGVQESATTTLGFLGSYRYMLTPRSAAEANYSFAQYDTRFVTNFLPNFRAHTRQQEISVAYVYSLNFRRFSPFAEAGPAAVLFGAIRDNASTSLDLKRTTAIGAMFGAGVAYEISPSFDLRVQYRGLLVQAPDFRLTDLKANRYEVISLPTVGVAYHF